MSNRFAVLSLDEDSDVEKKPLVQKIQKSDTKQIVCRICKEEHWSKDCPKARIPQEKQNHRNWKVSAEPVENKREWNLSKDGSKPVFLPFSKDKVFQQPHHKKYPHHNHRSRPMKYMFQDDDTSISLESVKNPTPEKDIDISGNEQIQASYVPELLQLQESTLADKIKKALEKQEHEKQQVYQDISGASYTALKLNRVISMKTKD